MESALRDFSIAFGGLLLDLPAISANGATNTPTAETTIVGGDGTSFGPYGEFRLLIDDSASPVPLDRFFRALEISGGIGGTEQNRTGSEPVGGRNVFTPFLFPTTCGPLTPCRNFSLGPAGLNVRLEDSVTFGRFGILGMSEPIPLGDGQTLFTFHVGPEYIGIFREIDTTATFTTLPNTFPNTSTSISDQYIWARFGGDFTINFGLRSDEGPVQPADVIGDPAPRVSPTYDVRGNRGGLRLGGYLGPALRHYDVDARLSANCGAGPFCGSVYGNAAINQSLSQSDWDVTFIGEAFAEVKLPVGETFTIGGLVRVQHIADVTGFRMPAAGSLPAQVTEEPSTNLTMTVNLTKILGGSRVTR